MWMGLVQKTRKAEIPAEERRCVSFLFRRYLFYSKGVPAVSTGRIVEMKLTLVPLWRRGSQP